MAKFIFALILGCISLQFAAAQTGYVKVEVDDDITRIIKLRANWNKELSWEHSYRIQLYYGSLSKAQDVIKEFAQFFPNWKTTLRFETPNYKVWAMGDYRDRLEADRALEEVKRKFPSAFLLLPQ